MLDSSVIRVCAALRVLGEQLIIHCDSMQKHLYFICPTDHLEPVINHTFKQENYYLTSLGNAMAFDIGTVGILTDLLEGKHIRDVSFVLSDDNRIVLDALAKKDFSEIAGVNGVRDQIVRQKERCAQVWQSSHRQFLVLSYHLNQKIKELKLVLKCLSIDPPRIRGIIYKRSEQVFSNIHSDLICREYYSLN